MPTRSTFHAQVTVFGKLAPDARGALSAQRGVDPASAASVRIGIPVIVRPVYGPHATRVLHGTTAAIGDAVNPLSHPVTASATRATPPDLPTRSALPARIDTATFTAWAVPRAALREDAQGAYVYQVVDGRAKRVSVKVLVPNGTPVAVRGAVDHLTPIITLGSHEVAEGDPVRATARVATTSRGIRTR